MLSWLKQWRNQRIIKNNTISETQWSQAFKMLPILFSLSSSEKQRLREMATLFLHRKSIEGARGFRVTPQMALIISLQACLLILNLDLNWYRGWVSVIVYPSQFVPERAYIDNNGIEHSGKVALSGESWHRGPVVLSWQDTERSGIVDGSNLVIHEFAHKLDLLNSAANGFPPLHKNMHKHQWTEVFSQAYANIQLQLNTGMPIPIDSYAATSPAEFFAVISEVFFERPDIVERFFPDVFLQLILFYKQNPLARISAIS